jgi:sugar-specific transcriptional regulator TrmB
MQQEELRAALTRLGLSDYEARAYLALLLQGPEEPRVLPFRCGIPRTKVYATLRRLQQKGLVYLLDDGSKRYAATPPEEAFSRTLQELLGALRSARQAVRELSRLREAGLSGRKVAEGKHYLLSGELLEAKLEELMTSAKRRLLIYLSPSLFYALEGLRAKLFALASSPELEARAILSALLLEEEQAQLPLPTSSIRVSTRGLRLGLFMTEERLLLSPAEGDLFLLFGTPEVLELAGTLFEELWSSSYPLHSVRKFMGRPSAADLVALTRSEAVLARFIERLLEGVTDAAYVEQMKSFVGWLEQAVGLRLGEGDLEHALQLLTAFLEASAEGSVARYDPLTRIMTLEADDFTPYSLAWLGALTGYAALKGGRLQVLHSAYGEKSKVLQLKVADAKAAQLGGER